MRPHYVQQPDPHIATPIQSIPNAHNGYLRILATVLTNEKCWLAMYTNINRVFILLYTIVRGRIKGAACGHVWHIYTAQRRPQGVYC